MPTIRPPCGRDEWFDGKTPLQTPDELATDDPELYSLLGRVYADL